MTDALLFLAALGISWVCFYYYYKVLGQEKQQQESSPNSRNHDTLGDNNVRTSQQPNAELDIKQFCYDMLTKLNCEVQTDETDPAHLRFIFQGEPFHIEATQGCLMICIWNTWWATFDINDIDEVARVRKAINIVNTNGGLTMLYSIDEETQKLAVHTKRNCLLIPEIPNTEQYLIAMLSGFFNIQHYFKDVLDDLRKEENA